MNLKQQAFKGVFWTTLGTVGTGFIGFILTMILARLLTPSDYGLLELLSIFTVLSNTFVDSGFSQAIIRDNNASQKDLSSVFYLNIIIAVFIYVLLFIFSPVIADFYNEASLIDLSRFVFLVIIFESLTIVQNANYARTMQFRPQSIASVFSAILSGIIAVIMAFKGFGVWALAFNLVLNSLFKMLLYWIQSKWFPSFVFSWKSVKKYFKFGVNLLLQGLLDKFVSNLESLLIGRFYTKAELGKFSQARKFDSYITLTVNSVIQKVSYPTLAKLQDDDRSLKNGYRTVLTITMMIMIPLMLFSSVFAENMILTFFGDKWISAAIYFRLWCICGLLVSFYQVFINIFLVKGRSKLLLKVSFCRQVLRIVAVLLFLKYSVLYLMISILVVTFFSAIFYVIVASKLINYTLREIIKDNWMFLFASILSLLITYFISYYIINVHMVLMLTIQVGIMFVSYLILLLLMHNNTISEFYGILKSLRNASR